jgi:hypothetical protein
MNPRQNPALAAAIRAAIPSNLLSHLHIPPAPQSATKTHTAPQISPQLRKTNPTQPPNPQSTIRNRQSQKPLNPNQLTAARLLLAGQSVTAVAASLRVDPYTISRWKKDPRFQAELRRQIHLQANPPTRAAPQCATPRHNFYPFLQNEPTARKGDPNARHA